jgi:hypothetical protein
MENFKNLMNDIKMLGKQYFNLLIVLSVEYIITASIILIFN